MSKHTLIASMLAGALVLSACSASANIGASSTPAPPPTAQPPQIIVVQPPPQVAATKQDDTDFVIVVLVVTLIVAGGLAAAGAAYLAGHMAGRADAPASPTPAAGNYLVEMTPAQFYEWSQLQTYKARRIAEAQSQWMVRRG